MQQAAKGGEKEVQEVPSVCTRENPADTFCSVCCDNFEKFLMTKWKSGTCSAMKIARLVYLL
jgi:hypothetical protein